MFFLATDCRDDWSLPMLEVIVCLKNAARENDPEILAFRKELQEQQNVRIFHFDNAEGLGERLRKVCGEWVQWIIAGGGGNRSTALARPS
jgi:hypothetical protein